MRVLDLTFPASPLFAVDAAARRLRNRLDEACEWARTWLPVIRARAGIGQAELALRLGISQGWLCNLEAGKVAISESVVVNLIEWLESLPVENTPAPRG